MENEEKMLLIRNFNLWSEISEEEYKTLHVVDNYKEAKEKDFIYFEAFNYNMVHFIKKGYIRLGHLDEDGNQVTKDILKKGDIFGQIILEKSDLHGEFAQAIKSDVSFCSFTIDNFKNLLKNRPELALKYSKLVGLKLRKFENRLINILQRNVKTRLVHFLEQQLSEKQNGKPAVLADTRMPSYLTHEEIAHLIGTTRQSVTTLLNELKDEGVLSYNRKEIRFFKLSPDFIPR